jgi:hypothetical protein
MDEPFTVLDDGVLNADAGSIVVVQSACLPAASVGALGQTRAHVPAQTPHSQAEDMYGERVVPHAMRLPSLEEDATVHGRPNGKFIRT